MDKLNCRLTYWLNRRLYSAPTDYREFVGYARHHPVRLCLPPLHRRGISGAVLFQQPHVTTTPSGYACHPSAGGELSSADTSQPPRQATPATPPQEGNCLVQTRYNHPVRLRRRVQTRCDCSSVSVLVISPPQEGNCLVQIRHNHPVRLRLPPLHRRGIV